MITQKITYNKDTGNIMRFQEYNNGELTTEELYNKNNMIIQRNYHSDNTMVKLFFDDEYWYVLKKSSYGDISYSNKITKYKKQDTPYNPIEKNLALVLGDRIKVDSVTCDKLYETIDNGLAVLIIKQVFKKQILERYDLCVTTLP